MQSMGMHEMTGFFSSIAAPPARQPDVVVFNYHSDRPDSLIVCSTLKALAPLAATVVIVSPGPALKFVRAWVKQTRSIDVVIEKPLSDERFYMAVEEILRLKAATREMTARSERLANLVPEGALPVIEHGRNNEAEMFEAAVLFTDVRGSSGLIREMPPHDFFDQLNQLLSTQARSIQNHQGSVIKYTGDGVSVRGFDKAIDCVVFPPVGSEPKPTEQRE